MIPARLRSAAPLALAFLVPAVPVSGQVDVSLLHGMRARSIGPAGMSGRIADIAAHPRDPNVVYVGASTGGLWKSVNGGITWTPLFDEQPVSGIGAVALSPSAPDVVWVGTGEGNPRNSAGVGAGVYKSMDGGATWSLVGLERSERIHRIIVHPTDPDVAWVAALGPAWSDGEERGVFKTTDGGATWRRVLWVNPRTGASDLVMDPRNPNKLFAGLWEYRRQPWFFESGGEGSGVYVSHDGGESWKRYGVEDGMPEGTLGRVGLAIARNVPDVVYALVEAERSALLRSDDGGRSWTTVNAERSINPRPFYYTDIRVDPQNENRLFNLHSRLERSEDGGRTWTTIGDGVHSDHHALWIHPDDSRLLYLGTDGGVYISRDRGNHWQFVDNLPVGQFYHVSVDTARPFNIYGGMQDNGSWRGPSDSWDSEGILNAHWREVGFGDGFATVVDPADPGYGYAMSQGGALIRWNLATGERKELRPWGPDSVDLRFNWNAGIATDPHEVGTIYYGSQYLHRSTDRGDSWDILSPDLTTNDSTKQRQRESGGITRDATGAENHTTILTIAPSPVQQGVIWVGTDDGNVQLSTDGGETWTNVAERIRGVPPATWVPHIEASKHDAGTAFVVFDDHRRGNWTTYVYRTTDFGRTWNSLATPDIDGFVHVLEEDPVEPRLLWLGTEFGLFVSLDAGERWSRWAHGVPSAPVRSLVTHPRDHDLVVGTHGRALYVLDDVGPLRALARQPALARSTLHFFEPEAAYQYPSTALTGYHFPADAMFQGERRPYGALLHLWSAEDGDSLEVRVSDARGETVRTFRAAIDAGLNRFAWDLRGDPPRVADDGQSPWFRRFNRGPEVLPGRYALRVALEDGTEASTTVEVLGDPRVEIPMVARQEKFEAVLRANRLQESLSEGRERLRKLEQAVARVEEALADRQDAEAQGLRDATKAFREKLRGAPEKLDEVSRLRRTISGLASSWDAPTQAQKLNLDRYDRRLQEALADVDRFFAQEVAPYRERVAQARLEWIPGEATARADEGGR